MDTLPATPVMPNTVRHARSGAKKPAIMGQSTPQMTPAAIQATKLTIASMGGSMSARCFASRASASGRSATIACTLTSGDIHLRTHTQATATRAEKPTTK